MNIFFSFTKSHCFTFYLFLIAQMYNKEWLDIHLFRRPACSYWLKDASRKFKEVKEGTGSGYTIQSMENLQSIVYWCTLSKESSYASVEACYCISLINRSLNSVNFPFSYSHEVRYTNNWILCMFRKFWIFWIMPGSQLAQSWIGSMKTSNGKCVWPPNSYTSSI